ncbi:hypothetical protein NKR19_g9195 [Coniochaeta hoffmannii]|uniref:Uncharacterized protein n=1 Tax=Coniochaeta hoffmannii TaxID=91930 RepID=A0AA38RII7_9PEZI|nr:hypothetical protein NKR19_g9195 [Coniochaeta hoffmannii]
MDPASATNYIASSNLRADTNSRIQSMTDLASNRGTYPVLNVSTSSGTTELALSVTSEYRTAAMPVHGVYDPRNNVPGIHPEAAHQQQSQYPGQQPQGQHLRPAPLNTSTAAMRQRDLSTSTADSYPYSQGSTAGSYATLSNNIPQSGMRGYAPTSATYGEQQDARQAPSCQTSSYDHPGKMYNVPQAAGTNKQVYDTSQQYRVRQPASANLMMAGAHTYYQGSPTGYSSAATTLQAQGQTASSASQLYQQPSHLAMKMTPQTTSSTADTGRIEEQQQQQQQAIPVEEDPLNIFASYDSQLRQTFREIEDGDLAKASATLLTTSSLLRAGFSPSGLVSDDSRAGRNRSSVWRDFNNAWLALLQRQKDMVESHQQLGPSQSSLTLEALYNMGKQLVALADVLEKHGLVDYEIGLWEERIVNILEECCNLYEQANANTSSSS